jgi:PAS domain S-box-containing protein
MRRLLIILSLVGCGISAPLNPLQAQPQPRTREYTEQQPLVYEDSWNLWPYSFLNDNGEPEGFNIDVIRLLLGELNIPYVIKLKPRSEALIDLRDGRADLVMGLAAGFHDEYGQYGQNTITLFTQSVASPKDKPVAIRSFKDLEHNSVIVMDSSLCHHLMIDYGWEDNAHPTENIRVALQRISTANEGQVVWNDLSLKWLIKRYNLDNLRVTPVNMPHGEHKFMSNDPELLKRLDDTYSRLYTDDKFTPIQNKWFYPDRQHKAFPTWLWYAIGVASSLILVLVIYAVSYRIQVRRLTRENSRHNKRLALIIETSEVRMWTYDIARREFVWRNENGQAAYRYSYEAFSKRYSTEDFYRVTDALAELSAQPPLAAGEKEREITLHVKARDSEDSDTELRDFVVHLSVLSRDRHGKPTVIIGTKKDITSEREQQRLKKEMAMRFWAVFNTPIIGIMLFDRNGILIDINNRACDMFGCIREEILAERVPLHHVLDTGHLDLHNVDGFSSTQFVNLDLIPASQRKVHSIHRGGLLCNEFSLLTVDDGHGELTGIFAICKDVTERRTDADMERRMQAELVTLRSVLTEYERNIGSLLHESDIRLATYSPDSHMLTIYRTATVVQHALTQTRCMSLVDERSQRIAMRALSDMDERADHEIDINLRTTLRIHGLQLIIHFSLTPVRDDSGRVVEYFGLCRDISELRNVEQQTAEQQAILQDVENMKSGFVKNMVQEIRRPMHAIMQNVGRLNADTPVTDEDAITKSLLDNSNTLLHLIGNILHLSRLQAHMVEINRQPTDFATLFEKKCSDGWDSLKNAQTNYIVENPYEHLEVDIDADNLGQVISQVTSNAAKHTARGFVRARYDYIGRRLIISVDDTGDGIPMAELERINRLDDGMTPETKGLGLAICKEIISQMGGTIELSSEHGSGTTVYITIPCHATNIKRNRHL